VSYARERLADDRWELHVRDVAAEGLPEFDDSFDVVFSMATLVHVEPGPAKAQLVRRMWELTRKRLVLVEAHSPHRGGVDRGVSDSPFWVDDYRAYLPELRDLGVSHSGAQDSLDGVPIARLASVVRPLRGLQSAVASLARRPHAQIYRTLVADR
jgi:SAM-dependent methyltransferase